MRVEAWSVDVHAQAQKENTLRFSRVVDGFVVLHFGFQSPS